MKSVRIPAVWDLSVEEWLRDSAHVDGSSLFLILSHFLVKITCSSEIYRAYANEKRQKGERCYVARLPRTNTDDDAEGCPYKYHPAFRLQLPKRSTDIMRLLSVRPGFSFLQIPFRDGPLGFGCIFFTAGRIRDVHLLDLFGNLPNAI